MRCPATVPENFSQETGITKKLRLFCLKFCRVSFNLFFSGYLLKQSCGVPLSGKITQSKLKYAAAQCKKKKRVLSHSCYIIYSFIVWVGHKVLFSRISSSKSVFSASFLASLFSCQLYCFAVHLMFCSFTPTLFSFSQKSLWHNISYTWPSSLAAFLSILSLMLHLVVGTCKPSVIR